MFTVGEFYTLFPLRDTPGHGRHNCFYLHRAQLVLLLNVDSVVLSYFLQGRPVLSRSEISRYPKLTLKDRSIKQSWRQQHLNILPRLGLRVDQSALRKRKTCLHPGDAEDNSDRKHFFQEFGPGLFDPPE